MVISSVSEGGANAISEAAVAGVLVMASRMNGNVELLCADYLGDFPIGNTRAPAHLLERLELEPAFVAHLTKALSRHAPLYRPARENAAWRRLLSASTAISACFSRSPSRSYTLLAASLSWPSIAFRASRLRPRS